MKETILSVLKQHFSYNENAIAEYAHIARLRLGSTTQSLQDEMKFVISNQAILENIFLGRNRTIQNKFDSPCLLKLQPEQIKTEMKYLDFKNLQNFLKWKGINPHMRAYLEEIQKEIQSPTAFSPKYALQLAEQQMFDYLFQQRFEEDTDKLSNIANRTLRIVLQEWLLHPEFVNNKEDARIIVDSLDLSNCLL